MKDKLLQKNSEIGRELKSPLEKMKQSGGRAHKVTGMSVRGADSMIAVYNDRFTYTFIMNKEVASIHFDKNKQKIFFSGHNIENLDLTAEQKVELHNLINILEKDTDGRELKNAYEATLGSRITDNK